MKAAVNSWVPAASALVPLMSLGLAVVLKDEQVNGVMKWGQNTAFRGEDW